MDIYPLTVPIASVKLAALMFGVNMNFRIAA